jgi:hypothetical protein
MQVVAFIPLAYMCVCTYFSLIRLGMMTIYYLAPKHTSSVSLLMLCSMVARYAAPLCYNFLYLIRLRTRDGKPSLTVFETVYTSQRPVASQSCFCGFSFLYCQCMGLLTYNKNVTDKLCLRFSIMHSWSILNPKP